MDSDSRHRRGDRLLLFLLRPQTSINSEIFSATMQYFFAPKVPASGIEATKHCVPGSVATQMLQNHGCHIMFHRSTLFCAHVAYLVAFQSVADTTARDAKVSEGGA